MKYKICIIVTCPDLPKMEDIPEHMELEVEGDDKIEAIKFALKASIVTWTEAKEKFDREQSIDRMNR
jgi:hypothetical protein